MSKARFPKNYVGVYVVLKKRVKGFGGKLRNKEGKIEFLEIKLKKGENLIIVPESQAIGFKRALEEHCKKGIIEQIEIQLN